MLHDDVFECGCVSEFLLAILLLENKAAGDTILMNHHNSRKTRCDEPEVVFDARWTYSNKCFNDLAQRRCRVVELRSVV